MYVHSTHNERRRGQRPVHHDQVHAWRRGHRLGTMTKHLRRTASGAEGNGLGATMKYLRRTTSAAANNCLSTTIIPPRSAASFEVNSEPHTGARPSVRLCVGPERARCFHHTTSKRCLIVPTRALGWATDPRKYENPSEGCTRGTDSSWP
jgi:hypothetical protein